MHTIETKQERSVVDPSPLSFLGPVPSAKHSVHDWERASQASILIGLGRIEGEGATLQRSLWSYENICRRHRIFEERTPSLPSLVLELIYSHVTSSYRY